MYVVREKYLFSSLKNELTEVQTMYYVVYIIFDNEQPIYVGATNDFNKRKQEHLSKKYREMYPNKYLYRYIDSNKLDSSLSMYIYNQSNSKKEISNIESDLIYEMRHLGYNIKNHYKANSYYSTENAYDKALNKVFSSIKGIMSNIEFGISIKSLLKKIDAIDLNCFLELISVCPIYNFSVRYDNHHHYLSERNKGLKKKKHIYSVGGYMNKLYEEQQLMKKYFYEGSENSNYSQIIMFYTLLLKRGKIDKHFYDSIVCTVSDAINYLIYDSTPIEKLVFLLDILHRGEYEQTDYIMNSHGVSSIECYSTRDKISGVSLYEYYNVYYNDDEYTEYNPEGVWMYE